MRIGLLLLAIPFVSATALNVASGDDSQISVYPSIPAESLRSPLDVTLPAVDEAPETNAQRLARGLAPLPPRGVYGHSTSHHRPTRVHAARAGVSATSLAGVLQVTKGDGTPMGYVNRKFTSWGGYDITDDINKALPASAGVTADGYSFDLANGNPDTQAAYPFVGLTNGFYSADNNRNSNPTSFSYLTGVQQSQRGSSNGSNKPNSFTTATDIEEVSESVIWTYDPATGNIVANWYNTDGTLVPLKLVYNQDDSIIIAAVNPNNYRAVYGQQPDITLKFVMPSL